MLKTLRGIVAYWVAGDELRELERRRILYEQYRRWLAEFPDIAITLDNLEAEAGFKAPLGIGSEDYPPSDQGPWSIEVLREKLRAGFHVVRRKTDKELISSFSRVIRDGY